VPLATSPTRSLGSHSFESQLSVTSTTFVDECASSYSSQGRRGSPLRGTVAEHVTLKERKSAPHHWRNKELPAHPVKTDELLNPPLTLATMAQPKKVVSLYRSLHVPLEAWEDLAEASLPKSPVSAMADFSSDAAVVDEDETSDDLDGDLDGQNVEPSNGAWPQLTPYRPGFGTHFGLGEETPTTPWGLSPEQPRRIPHKIATRLGLGGFRDDKGPSLKSEPQVRVAEPLDGLHTVHPASHINGKSSPSLKSVDKGREAPAMAPDAYVRATWTHWRADVDAAFARTDTNGDGQISRTELVRACRLDDGMRALLGLSEQIQLEDGTRDAFERLIGRLEEDSKKVRREAAALVSSTITLDTFRAILAPELLRAHHASSARARDAVEQMCSSSDSRHQTPGHQTSTHQTSGHETSGHQTSTHQTSGQVEYPWGFVPLPGRLLPSSPPTTRPPPPPSRSAVVEACCSPHVTTPSNLRCAATLEAARRHWRPLVPFVPPVTFGRTHLHYLDRAREAARSGCDRVEVAIEAISRLTPAHLGAIQHLYMLLVESRHGAPSTTGAALSASEWRHFCMHFLRQPSSFGMLLPMTLLLSLHERFERRCAHAAAQAEPGTRYCSSDGSNALAPSAPSAPSAVSAGVASAGVISAGVGAFIGLLCEVADHWARRNGFAPTEPPLSASYTKEMAAAVPLAGTASVTAPDLGLFEAIRVRLRLPPGLPALHYLLDRIAIASDPESENGGDAVKRSQRHAIIHAIRRRAGQRFVKCTSLDRALEPLRLWPVPA
jgi:hypothetical protein